MSAAPDATVVSAARAAMLDFGVAIQYVFPVAGERTCPYAYTVGLTAWEHPELLIAGASPEVSAGVLNALAVKVSAGEVFGPGDVCLRLMPEEYEMMIAGPVLAAGPGGEYAIDIARAVFAESELPLPYQVVYEDGQHRFPWDPGCSLTMQPLLAAMPLAGAQSGRRQTMATRWGWLTPGSWRWPVHVGAVLRHFLSRSRTRR